MAGGPILVGPVAPCWCTIFKKATRNIKLHGGIAYRMPAGPLADIQGTDKWRTLIQNTVSAA